MVAYEFYSRDESGELYLIGVLPERRSDQERITDESIIKWARSLLGDESGVNNISYSTIKLEKSNNENFYPIPISQKELWEIGQYLIAKEEEGKWSFSTSMWLRVTR